MLVVLVGAAGRCVEATRAMTDTTRTIVTRSARVLRSGRSLFIGAPEHVVTIEGDEPGRNTIPKRRPIPTTEPGFIVLRFIGLIWRAFIYVPALEGTYEWRRR